MSVRIALIMGCLTLLSLFLTPLSHSPARGIAQDLSLQEELSQRQEQQRQEIESLETERASIASQMSELIAEASRIEQKISRLQTTPTLEFKLGELPDFMEKTFGVCQVQASAVPYEFFIKKGDVEIQFSFQEVSEDVIGSIALKSVGLNNRSVLEVQLQPVYPSGHQATRTAAVVRLDPESMEVVHATFTGRRVNDRFLGRDSMDLEQVVCEL